MRMKLHWWWTSWRIGLWWDGWGGMRFREGKVIATTHCVVVYMLPLCLTIEWERPLGNS